MIRFDDALPKVMNLLSQKFGGHPELRSHVVRDLSGSVVVVLPDSALVGDEWEQLAQAMDEELKPYSPGVDRVLLRESDLIDETEILNSTDKVSLPLANSWLIDRLLTNQDWIRPPLRQNSRIPTAVAFSIKGGVGRSTAFAMLAWYFAREGKNVFVVDLDLEAPGIGELLLDKLPENGLADWLIESVHGHDNFDFLTSTIAESPIGYDEAGTVHVIPAYGSNTKNYISKLGRVYATNFDGDGKLLGLTERLDLLLETIQKLSPSPDVILLDSRAGMHDIGSTAVTRLGAEVFLFARNDEQNWWSYQQIFDHLKSSKSVSHGMGSDDDLRWKLKMIAAQTNIEEAARKEWIDASYEQWNRFYDDESAGVGSDFSPYVFDRDDIAAPHNPLFINFESTVRSVSIKDLSKRPDWGFINGVFGHFFVGAKQILFPTEKTEVVEEQL